MVNMPGEMLYIFIFCGQWEPLLREGALLERHSLCLPVTGISLFFCWDNSDLLSRFFIKTLKVEGKWTSSACKDSSGYSGTIFSSSSPETIHVLACQICHSWVNLLRGNGRNGVIIPNDVFFQNLFVVKQYKNNINLLTSAVT